MNDKVSMTPSGVFKVHYAMTWASRFNYEKNIVPSTSTDEMFTHSTDVSIFSKELEIIECSNNYRMC